MSQKVYELNTKRIIELLEEGISLGRVGLRSAGRHKIPGHQYIAAGPGRIHHPQGAFNRRRLAEERCEAAYGGVLELEGSQG